MSQLSFALIALFLLRLVKRSSDAIPPSPPPRRLLDGIRAYVGVDGVAVVGVFCDDHPRVKEEIFHKAFDDAEAALKERFKSIDGFQSVGFGWANDSAPRDGDNARPGFVVTENKAENFSGFPFWYETPGRATQVRLGKMKDVIVSYL
jgi:hypothetical protein